MDYKKDSFITEEFNKGTKLYLRGKKDEAIIYFKTLSKKYPQLAEPHIVLGAIYFNGKNMKDAFNETKIALFLDPDNPLIHNNLGNIYKEIGEKDRALSEYKKAVELNPEFSLGHINLSLMYEEMGRVEDAMIHLEEATKSAYKLPDKGLSLFFRLSIYYIIFNRFDDSERLLKRILKKTLFNTKREIVNLRRRCNLLIKSIGRIRKLKGRERVDEIIKILKELEFKDLLKFVLKNSKF